MSRFKPREDLDRAQVKALWEEMGSPSDADLAKEVERRFSKPMSRHTAKKWRHDWTKAAKQEEQKDILDELDGMSDPERLKRTNKEVGKAVAKAAVYFQKNCDFLFKQSIKDTGDFLFKMVRAEEIHVNTTDKVPMIAERQNRVIDVTPPAVQQSSEPTNGSAPPISLELTPISANIEQLFSRIKLVK